VENILLTVFFMELGKKETRPHNVCLPFSLSEIEQICGYSFLCMLSKKETHVPEIRDTRLVGPFPRIGDAHLVGASLFIFIRN
jgi:hypothetical protein